MAVALSHAQGFVAENRCDGLHIDPAHGSVTGPGMALMPLAAPHADSLIMPTSHALPAPKALEAHWEFGIIRDSSMSRQAVGGSMSVRWSLVGCDGAAIFCRMAEGRETAVIERVLCLTRSLRKIA
jgi:hypothetical protein